MTVGVKLRSMRRARSGAVRPPCPLMLWHCTHPWDLKRSSPRRASPGAACPAKRGAAVASAAATATRSRVMAVLLSRHSEAGHKNVGAEGLEEKELLSESVVLPFGVPAYIFVQR